METGHVVRFSSQPHPFLIETSHCLDQQCDCAIMGLTFTELDLSVSRQRDRLQFTLRVCLRTWSEQDPPPRSLEVESLVREFLARFPTERIRELGDDFQRSRAVERRLQSFSLADATGELVTYSEVIDPQGGVRDGVVRHAFFFVFEGREFLVEDHYCVNPDCDCQQVHVEFWERVHRFHPEHCIKISQRLMAAFTLGGKLKEIRYSEETASTTKYLLLAWQRRCGEQLQAFRRRYDVIKSIGARSLPRKPKLAESGKSAKSVKNVKNVKSDQPARNRGATSKPPRTSEPPSSNVGRQSIRRNDPCPCGSGLKFKRCCGRRAPIAD